MSGNLQKAPDEPVREVDWILFNADWLVTCDSRMTRYESGAVAIEGNRLVAVGASDEVKKSFRGKNQFDLAGYLLMPGLVNTHTHAAMSLFRGIGDDLPLKEWLEQVIFPAEGTFINPETVYLGTMLAAIEMLKSGTTCFCDGYFFENSAARAAIDCGIRAVLGQGILDFPSPDQPDPRQFMATAKEFLADFPENDCIRPSLFCHAPYTCGPNTLKSIKRLCREKGILFQTHLSETFAEVEEIRKRYRQRPGMHLQSLGVLDELTLCAHGTWVNDDEIRILARTGASVSNCPESNMKLASGVAPISALLSAGVRVGLGTDGCASNNNLDLFSEMDTAAKLHKVFLDDPLAFPAGQVLAAATREGAYALGLGSEIGSLEAGKKADLIAIDLNQPHLIPLYDPVSHLVYSARGSDVAFVWVDGKQVVSGGKVLSVDEAGILAEAREMGKRIGER